jgi:hypothetical protein
VCSDHHVGWRTEQKFRLARRLIGANWFRNPAVDAILFGLLRFVVQSAVGHPFTDGLRARADAGRLGDTSDIGA